MGLISLDEWATLGAVFLPVVAIAITGLRRRGAWQWWTYVGAAVLTAAGTGYLLLSAVVYKAGCETECSGSEESGLWVLAVITLALLIALVIVPPAAWFLRRRDPSRHPIRAA